MSDIFVIAGVKCDPDTVASNLSWTAQTKIWTYSAANLTAVVTRMDNPALWSPAYDSESKTYALIGGRIAPEEREWLEAENLPYEGGLASRIVINRWITGGSTAVESINGGAQIIVIDERNRELHVWTDRMGAYPAFSWTDGGLLLCSHPDVAASALEAAGRPCDFDPITMAEFLRTGTSVHPNTYWHGIRHMEAGTRFRFDFCGAPRLIESVKYWRPAYLQGKPYLNDRRDIVDRLSAALKSAVQRRTLTRLGKIGVLLSAGADSRTALFAASDPSSVTCYTYYDEPNAELAGASKLADIARAKHVPLCRSKEYYIEHANESVRVSGGMWTAESAHHTGFANLISADGIGTLLTGCYADYMLKGITFDRKNRLFLGKNLPLFDFSPFDFEWHHPHFKLTPVWNSHVDNRLSSTFGEFTNLTDQNRSRLEYLRLAQLVREPDASGRLFLRRTLPVDFFMTDNDLIELFGAICPREKLNGIVFGMAVARITGEVGNRVLNNNFGAQVGASEFHRVASFMKASALRKIRRQGGGHLYEQNPNSVATAGSWPHLGRVINLSEKLRAWRAELPVDNFQFLSEILGANRLGRSLDQWEHSETSLFFRFYTASLWLSQNRGALGRIKIT